MPDRTTLNMYRVSVGRKSYEYLTVAVEAQSQDKATQQAIDEAVGRCDDEAWQCDECEYYTSAVELLAWAIYHPDKKLWWYRHGHPMNPQTGWSYLSYSTRFSDSDVLNYPCPKVERG